jgi:hypothetical protein
MGLFLPYIAAVGAVVVSTIAHLEQGTLDGFAAWCRSFIILALAQHSSEVVILVDRDAKAEYVSES